MTVRDVWVVVLDTGSMPVIYGPLDDEGTARDFAAFLTRTVDPAKVYPLHSPERELLAWWRNGAPR